MYIKEIWRYPVKSVASESLQAATLTAVGVEGDRIIQVRNAQGRPITARTYPGLLGFKAVLDGDGNPLVDGIPWDDPQVLKAVRKVARPEAYLMRDEGPHRFDVLPLLGRRTARSRSSIAVAFDRILWAAVFQDRRSVSGKAASCVSETSSSPFRTLARGAS